MLNIEIIKFEAQDVITASTAAPAKCTCPDANNGQQREAAYECRMSGHPGCEFEGSSEAHNCFTVN